MPRLLQNSRRAKPPPARASRGEAPADHAPTELPPYEAPSFPMNESGKRALVEISNNRDTRKYEQHLAKSSGFLRESVGAINDRLHFRRTHVEQLAAKRTERGKEKSEFEAAAEEYAEKLGKEVSALTSQSESALREVIDYRAELEDEKAVLEQVHDQVHAQEPRQPRPERKRKVRHPDPPGDDDDDDEADDDGVEAKGEGEDVEMEEPEDETPYTGASEMLESIRRTKASEYGYLSMHERYGLNNDYISFKRTLHDAQYQDGVPLPDASTWFGPDGRPVVGIPRDRNNGDPKESQEEDEDLVIEREVLSFKCPLTQQTMKEPYSSRVCKHSFEKEAILTFIRENHGQCRCPECPAVLRATDVYFDEIMLRRIQRVENAARQNVGDTSDVEPDADADQSISIERSKQVKREGARSR